LVKRGEDVDGGRGSWPSIEVRGGRLAKALGMTTLFPSLNYYSLVLYPM